MRSVAAGLEDVVLCFVPTGVDDGREGGAHPAYNVQLQQIRAF